MRSKLRSYLCGERAVRPLLSNRSGDGVRLVEIADQSGSFRLTDVQQLDEPECPSLVQGACGPHDSRLDTHTQPVGDGFR